MNCHTRGLGLSLALSLVASYCLAEAPLSPLARPDTSSPRATLESCQNFISYYADLLRKQWVLGEAVAEEAIDDLEDKIARCFDLSEFPNERKDDVDSEVAIYLQEVLDRIEIPPSQDVPDAATVKSEELSRWRIPGTDISIGKVAEGVNEGEWVFDSATTLSLRDNFLDVRTLPYRSDARVGAIGPKGGLYNYSILYPEAVMPKGWIDALPTPATSAYFDQPVWKWIAMALILSVATLLFTLIARVSLRWTRQRDHHDSGGVHWEKLFPPVSGVLMALLADHLIDEIVGTTGKVDAFAETTLWVIIIACAAWALLVLGTLLAEAIIASPKIDSKGVNANLIMITGRVAGFTAAVWVLVEVAENLGISLIPVIAGLGVGGLAVALAVRPTLENLIGGFILFIDKPVRVGDRCRFGSQLGDVEEVGLRSTRIRTRENTLLTIPNAEFSQMQLENLSKRKLTLYQITLALRYETTPDQLRYVMAQTREMLLGHPKVSPHDLRVRFRDLGEYSLDVEIFAYTRTTEFGEYWAIREDLNLRIMDIVKEGGTGFAFPSTTEYFAPDSGLDSEQTLAAEERVRKWRAKGKLPFPEFDEETREQIENTLDYPPEGSPHHGQNTDVSEGPDVQAKSPHLQGRGPNPK